MPQFDDSSTPHHQAFGRRWQDAEHMSGVLHHVEPASPAAPQKSFPTPRRTSTSHGVDPVPQRTGYPVPRNAASSDLEFHAGASGTVALRDDMTAPRKSKALTVILALPFLPTSWLGIHSFYLGHNVRGILHLMLAFLSILPLLWFVVIPFHGFIIVVEFLLVIISAGGYGRDRQRRPLI